MISKHESIFRSQRPIILLSSFVQEFGQKTEVLDNARERKEEGTRSRNLMTFPLPLSSCVKRKGHKAIVPRAAVEKRATEERKERGKNGGGRTFRVKSCVGGWVPRRKEVDVIEEISPEEKNIRVDAQTFFLSLGKMMIRVTSKVVAVRSCCVAHRRLT